MTLQIQVCGKPNLLFANNNRCFIGFKVVNVWNFRDGKVVSSYNNKGKLRSVWTSEHESYFGLVNLGMTLISQKEIAQEQEKRENMCIMSEPHWLAWLERENKYRRSRGTLVTAFLLQETEPLTNTGLNHKSMNYAFAL